MNDKKTITIRCDAETLAKCKRISRKSYRSTNAQIEYFLELALRQYEKENGKVEVSDDDIYN